MIFGVTKEPKLAEEFPVIAPLIERVPAIAEFPVVVKPDTVVLLPSTTTSSWRVVVPSTIVLPLNVVAPVTRRSPDALISVALIVLLNVASEFTVKDAAESTVVEPLTFKEPFVTTELPLAVVKVPVNSALLKLSRLDAPETDNVPPIVWFVVTAKALALTHS